MLLPFLIFSGIMPQNYTSQSSITYDFSFLDSSEKNHEFYSRHYGLGFDVPIRGVGAGYRLVHVAQAPDQSVGSSNVLIPRRQLLIFQEPL